MLWTEGRILKIAIVGTSHIEPHEEMKARGMIAGLTHDFHGEIITGDANGIDALVKEMCPNATVCAAKDKSWEGEYGYKHRNIIIAQLADYVYSISTKIKKTRCYHCDTPNHERTGGCWTKRFAINKLGKKGETIVI